MLSICYLLLATWIGYHFLKKTLPQLFKLGKAKSLAGKTVPLPNWMVTIPASFLIGTLLVTWFTYLVSYGFYLSNLRNISFLKNSNPLLIGNLVTFLVFGLIACKIFRNQNRERQSEAPEPFNLSTVRNFVKEHRFEVVFLSILLIFAFCYMSHTLHVKNGTLFVGLSVFSDFGPHLAVLRSFSSGANFPTEYPHFPDGHARYHFLFQFLAGNLEFLGLRIDWAFNLPSILSFVAFFMLLYSLAVILMGERWVGIGACVLLFFRSAMAFFRFAANIPWWELPARIRANESFIGKTLREGDWGIWSQSNLYINQRHLAFSLGIMLLIIIIVLPLFKKMAEAISACWRERRPFREWLREFLLSADAWVPRNMQRSMVIGIILGLICFWHGAVMLSTLLILFSLALFSKHRLEYLNIAVFTVILAYIQTMFFVGPGGAVQPRMTIGFLSERSDLPGILAYYQELLGLMPFLLLIGLFTAPKGSRWLALTFLSPLIFTTVVQLTPDLAVGQKYVIISVALVNIIVANFLYRLYHCNFGARLEDRLQRGDFPILATGLPDSVSPEGETPVNEISNDNMVSESPATGVETGTSIGELTELETSGGESAEITGPETGDSCPEVAVVEEENSRVLERPKIPAFLKLTAKAVTIVLVLALTATGVVDFATYYNVNCRALELRMDDPVMLWVKQNTGPNEIFLTEAACIHPILLAGRKIFYGHPYFAWSAGYDTYGRDPVGREIYAGTNIMRVKELLKNNHISYIVIEDGNRNSQDYRLSEELIKTNFKLVYENMERRIAIYRTY